MAESDFSFAAWLGSRPGPALQRLQAQAELVAAFYPTVASLGPAGGFKAASLPQGTVELKDRGLELWPVLDAGSDASLLRLVCEDRGSRSGLLVKAQRLAQLYTAPGLILNLSKFESLSGLEQALLMLAEAFAGHGLPLRLCLRPQALSLQAAADLSEPAQGLQLCCAVAGAEPGPILSSAKELLGPWAEALDPEHLEVILPGHAWHWPLNSAPERWTWGQWTAWVGQHGPERRDPVSAELRLGAASGETWTLDSISVSAKLFQLRELGLRRVCFSGLGEEDPRLWALIDTLPQARTV